MAGLRACMRSCQPKAPGPPASTCAASAPHASRSDTTSSTAASSPWRPRFLLLLSGRTLPNFIVTSAHNLSREAVVESPQRRLRARHLLGQCSPARHKVAEPSVEGLAQEHGDRAALVGCAHVAGPFVVGISPAREQPEVHELVQVVAHILPAVAA